MQNAEHCAQRAARAKAKSVVLLLALGVLSARTACADVAMCVQSHADGQREVKAGHLKAASDLFAKCVSTDGCPDAIRAECTEFYNQTQTNTPTAIFAALDANGNDLTDVEVYIDDTLVQDGLNGRAVPLDPGKYAFRFQLPSGERLVAEALMREGEKNRIISVHIAPPKPPEPSAAEHSPASREQTRKAALPTAFWITAGVGAASVASFSLFALLGRAQQSKLDDCAPHCSEDRRANFDAMRRDYLISDISLGVGLASAGAAAWFYFSSRATDGAGSAQSARVSVLPIVSSNGAKLVVNATTF